MLKNIIRILLQPFLKVVMAKYGSTVIFTIGVQFLPKDKVKYANRKNGDEGTVVAVCIDADNSVLYKIAWSDKEQSFHYAIELELI